MDLEHCLHWLHLEPTHPACSTRNADRLFSHIIWPKMASPYAAAAPSSNPLLLQIQRVYDVVEISKRRK
jgi:hypothetical protein